MAATWQRSITYLIRTCMYYTDKILHFSGAPRARQRSLIAKKVLSSILPRKFGYDVSVRTPVRTEAGGGGKESQVGPLGEEYVSMWGEILHSKHLARFGGKSHGHAARTFRGKKTESFFPLNFNDYINLDNRERAKAKNKNSNGD